MPLTLVKLDTNQHSEWEKTRTTTTWHYAGFTHILYTLLNNSGQNLMAVFTSDVRVAAVDGVNLMLNPATFFSSKYNLMNRVFAMAHEILHCVFNHPEMNEKWAKAGFVAYPDGTKLVYDSELMNWSEDYNINALLISTKIGEFHPDWLFDPDLQAETKSVLEIYRELYKEKQRGRGRQPGKGGQGVPFDEVLPPGTSTPDVPPPPRSEPQWAATVAAAASLSKKQAEYLGAGTREGRGALEIARLFEKFLEPVIDWADKFVSSMTRKIGHDRYDWRRPDRRFLVRGIIVPAKSAFQIRHLIGSCDVSGSMNNTHVTRCYTEVGGMLESATPERLTLLWHDDEVHRVDEIEDIGDLYTMQKKEPPNWGGGTSFVPTFKWIEENCDRDPDGLVLLTDGYGTFPKKAPDYPVWWVCISPEGSVQFPFGEVIWMPSPVTEDR